MSPLDLAQALSSRGVPDDVIGDVPELPPTTSALMMYGSRARGDAGPGSDLDLLALVPRQLPAMNVGPVSLSFYTSSQLATGISSLFGAHLRRDGEVLFDRDGALEEALNRMGRVDTDRLLERVREMTALFTTPQFDLPRYLPGLLREARYLLRSTLYARAIAEGQPCFSVRELGVRNGDPDLARLLGSRHVGDPSAKDYEACRARLHDLIGDFPRSEHGSLEATVVNEWGSSTDLLSMAFMALGSAGGGSDYAEVEKILL